MMFVDEIMRAPSVTEELIMFVNEIMRRAPSLTREVMMFVNEIMSERYI